MAWEVSRVGPLLSLAGWGPSGEVGRGTTIRAGAELEGYPHVLAANTRGNPHILPG